MANLLDVMRLLFKFMKAPLLVVAALYVEDLVSFVEGTHFLLAQPRDHVPDVWLKANDVQLAQPCRSNLSLAACCVALGGCFVCLLLLHISDTNSWRAAVSRCAPVFLVVLVALVLVLPLLLCLVVVPHRLTQVV